MRTRVPRAAATSGITTYAQWGLARRPRCCAATTTGGRVGAGRGAAYHARGMDDADGSRPVPRRAGLDRRRAPRGDAGADPGRRRPTRRGPPSRPRRRLRSARITMRRSRRPGRLCPTRSTGRRSPRAARWTRPRPSRSPWGSRRGRGRTPAGRRGGSRAADAPGSGTWRRWWPAGSPTARSRPAWSSRSGRWRPTCSTSWTSSAAAPGRRSPPGRRPGRAEQRPSRTKISVPLSGIPRMPRRAPAAIVESKASTGRDGARSHAPIWSAVSPAIWGDR